MTKQTETSSFDRIVTALQEAIREQEEAMFSAAVLKEARQPRNMGIMLDPDGYALVCGPCGDTMEMFLRVQDSRIEVAAFMTDGCGPTAACGSMLTQMAQGKSLDEAAAIEAADLITGLDGLPPEHVHCATLAVHTLRQAIAACCSRGEGGRK
jgi:nitrogen fixation NifU-like protein